MYLNQPVRTTFRLGRPKRAAERDLVCSVYSSGCISADQPRRALRCRDRSLRSGFVAGSRQGAHGADFLKTPLNGPWLSPPIMRSSQALRGRSPAWGFFGTWGRSHAGRAIDARTRRINPVLPGSFLRVAPTHRWATAMVPPAEHRRPEARLRYEALALARAATRSRRRRFRSRLRRPVATGDAAGVAAGVESLVARMGGGTAAGTAADRASMISRTERPLSVMRQPPLSLSTRLCERCRGRARAPPAAWCVRPSHVRSSPGSPCRA